MNVRTDTTLLASLLASLALLIEVQLHAADLTFNGSVNNSPPPIVSNSGGTAATDPNLTRNGATIDNAQVRMLQARLDGMKPSDPDYVQTLLDLNEALGVSGMKFTSGSNTYYFVGGVQINGISAAKPASVPLNGVGFLPSVNSASKPNLKPIAAIPPFTPVDVLGPMVISLTVGGAMDPWLAGMPAGSTTKNSDTAPQNSPVYVGHVKPGQVLIFSSQNQAGLLDAKTISTMGHEAENGLAALVAPFHSLVGVFLDDHQPDITTTPEQVHLQPEDQTIQPGLRQVFYIGDGQTTDGTLRQYIVPAGATRFFLGASNSNGLSEQFGQFNVRIQVPRQPPPFLLWLIGGFGVLLVILIAFMALRNRSTADSEGGPGQHPLYNEENRFADAGRLE